VISGLKPYPEYRDSDLPWLGMLPSHWEQLRAKYLLREIDERSTKGIEELLSVSHLTGVTPRSQKNVTMFLAKSNIGHKICHPDDVVINTMWAWMGALGVARHSGLVSPSYGVYRPLRNCRMLPRYTDYLLRTPMYAAEYQRRSTGVNSSRLRLYPDQFLRVPVVLPPVDEQALIVKFLEHANRSFDSFIQAKRRQMTLLGELRQSVTEEALRSAGAKSLRVGVAAELVQRPVNRQRHLVYTPVGLFNRGRGIFHKPETKGAELGDSSFFWIEENDLVLSGQFAWEGAVALAGHQDKGCVASHRYPILRGRPEVANSAVLLAFFRTQLGALVLNEHSRGAAGRNRPLNVRSLLKEKIPIPPPPAQQRIIDLVLLEAEIADSVGRLIQAVREYRTRLIADVVAGRLDVRGAARRLPDRRAGEVAVETELIEEIGSTDEEVEV
jgi:type I restriction enzyme, S subunit